MLFWAEFVPSDCAEVGAGGAHGLSWACVSLGQGDSWGPSTGLTQQVLNWSGTDFCGFACCYRVQCVRCKKVSSTVVRGIGLWSVGSSSR